MEGSTINTDGWKAYDGLILNEYTHCSVYRSKDEFARGKCHVNGIEGDRLKEDYQNLYMLLPRKFRKNISNLV